MSTTPKHRFDLEEKTQAFDLLDPEERAEYDSLEMAGGISTAGKERLRKLETIAYTRLKEYKNEQG